MKKFLILFVAVMCMIPFFPIPEVSADESKGTLDLVQFEKDLKIAVAESAREADIIFEKELAEFDRRNEQMAEYIKEYFPEKR
jgi:hypothetical protein